MIFLIQVVCPSWKTKSSQYANNY